MLFEDCSDKLDGKVERDESYFDCKETSSRGRGVDRKTAFFEMIQRSNRLETRIVANVKANTLIPIVFDYVTKTAEVYTDEFKVYKALSTMGYSH